MTKLSVKEQNRIFDIYRKTKSQVKTAELTHHSVTTIWRYINAAGLGVGIGGNQEKQRKITDEQIIECIDTMTRHEIADKYGVHVSNLDRRMKKLGVHAVYATPKTRKHADEWHWTKQCAEMVERSQGGRFELVSFKKGRLRIRCKQCGTIIERSRSTVKEKNVSCEHCRRIETGYAIHKKYTQAKHECEKVKICPVCGKTFHSWRDNSIYCSAACKQKNKASQNIRKRCRKYGAKYESGITLRKVCLRDKGICQICGKPIDWNDNRWHENFGPNYPTIDHITPLAQGGSHTWDNVQLAHAMCNSCKRDLITA